MSKCNILELQDFLKYSYVIIIQPLFNIAVFANSLACLKCFAPLRALKKKHNITTKLLQLKFLTGATKKKTLDILLKNCETW